MDERQAEWFRRNLKLGNDWIVDDVDYRTVPLSLKVHVRFVGKPSCPVCGARGPGYDTRKREWRDLDYGNAKCVVVAEVPRVRCGTCGVHEIDVPWAGKASKLTLSLEQRILSRIRYSPVSVVAREFRVFDRTVWNIARHHADQMMRGLDLSDLEMFCIDETSSEKGQNYVTSIIDPLSGSMVFATPGRDPTVLYEFRVWLIHHGGDPMGIRVVCCDMSPSYIHGITEAFPKASIVFDPYHIIQAANRMVEDVRRKSGLKGKKAKGLRFGFVMNKEDLAERPDLKEQIEEVLHSYRDIGLAYAIKESLRDLYGIADPAKARIFLRLLTNYCLRSDLEDVMKFGETLNRHFLGIVAWHDHRINNGYSEGTNSVIQAMKAAARGYANVENMITMIYLKSGIKHPSVKGTLLPDGI